MVPPSPPATVPAVTEREPAPAPVSAPTPTRIAAPSEARVRPAPPRRPPVEAEPVSTREVIIRITGAMGGTLKVDGQPLEWFGDVRHALTLGPHQFEFIAPDNACCQSTSRVVNIVPGDGPQKVIGDIPFVDATLRVGGEYGQSGVLSCPTLFSGDHPFPPERRVAMSRVRATGTCTLRADAAGSPLQKMEVTLRAGQTTVIPWP